MPPITAFLRHFDSFDARLYALHHEPDFQIHFRRFTRAPLFADAFAPRHYWPGATILRYFHDEEDKTLQDITILLIHTIIIFCQLHHYRHRYQH